MQTTKGEIGKLLPTSSLPQMPKGVIMKDGQEVSLEGLVWRAKVNVRLKKSLIINWSRLQNVVIANTRHRVLTDRAIHIVMLYIADSLRYLKIGSTKARFQATLRFARWLADNKQWLPSGGTFDWSDLTEDCFSAWLETEYKTAGEGYAPSYLRSFYRWGADPDALLTDFSEQLSQILDNKRIRIPRGGEAILSRDKRRGPFNREEVKIILDACLSSKGKDQDRALTWVLVLTGMRPEQIALLRNRDLQAFVEQDEECVSGDGLEQGPRHAYQLKVRIIKRPYSEEQYRLIPISRECGELLEQLRKPGSRLDDSLIWWLRKSFNHGVIYRLERFFKDADLRSPRLPITNPDPDGPFFEIMPSNPRRFRYALATGRIAMGDSPQSVSDFLCQSDPASLWPYVETSPLIADDFQSATDHAVVPLVGKMQGRMDDPDNPSDAPLIPGIVPQASSRRELRVLGPIGKCDVAGLCPRNPVTGCFGCPSFIARPDAPLKELRAAILEDVEADLVEGASPQIVDLMKSTLNDLDQWIAHIERAKLAGSRQI